MLPTLCLLALGLQAKPPLLMNGTFSDDLKGWTAEGNVKVKDQTLEIGPGRGAVRQRYDVPGLRILFFGAMLKPSGPEATARIRLQCFDAQNRPLMEVTGAPDPKKQAGIYLKTQAHTAYVMLSIEKTSDAGSLVADGATLTDDDKDRVEHAPHVDLDAAMHPIWQGRRVLDESVLLLAEGDRLAQGRLMFRPSKVVAVKDATLAKTYTVGKDFTVEGDRIVATKESAIPTMRDSELAKGQYPWTPLEGRHVFVTYEHRDAWKGPVPTYQGERLSETSAKLIGKQPLTIVACGDSITLGINVSGFRNVPPYLPPWPSLVVHQLGRKCRHKGIKLYNTALGGMTSGWALENARDTVAALDPDLVLIAFGMNDFWSLTPTEFRKNVEAMMATVQTRHPKCEFLLVASMKFDPAYTTEQPYVNNLAGYADELKKLGGPGVAVFDMTALSDALYRAKSAKDLGTDPMHPDDFLARWYAQGVVATMVK